MDELEREAVRAALRRDLTIDIVTTGARSGQPRTAEIWFTNIDGRILICGTPTADGSVGGYTPRDWMANLVAEPRLVFRLKESVTAELQAEAAIVTDPEDRRAIMTAPETQWYRDNGGPLEEVIEHAPIVEIRFVGEAAWLEAG